MHIWQAGKNAIWFEWFYLLTTLICRGSFSCVWQSDCYFIFHSCVWLIGLCQLTKFCGSCVFLLLDPRLAQQPPSRPGSSHFLFSALVEAFWYWVSARPRKFYLSSPAPSPSTELYKLRLSCRWALASPTVPTILYIYIYILSSHVFLAWFCLWRSVRDGSN